MKIIEEALNCLADNAIQEKFNSFKNVVNENNFHKFANAKTYFDYHFGISIKNFCGVSLPINRHKSELARILKEQQLPNDFRGLLVFLGI